jgi:hypothetical protein
VAEHRDGTGRSLVLQRVDVTADVIAEHTEERAAEHTGEHANLLELVDDGRGCCLVTDTAATAYDAVTAVRLHHRTLQIRLTQAGAAQLNLPTRLTITLDLDDHAVNELRDGLRRVLSGHAGRTPPPPPRLQLD